MVWGAVSAIGSLAGGIGSIMGGMSAGKRDEQNMKEYRKMLALAMQQEAEKYNLSKTEVEQWRQRINQMLNSFSDQGLADIRQNYQNTMSAGMNNLTSRGLSASTLVPSLQRGATRAMNADTANYRDMVLSRQMGADQAATGSMLGVIGNRTTFMPNAPQQTNTSGSWASGLMGVGSALGQLGDWWQNRGTGSTSTGSLLSSPSFRSRMENKYLPATITL